MDKFESEYSATFKICLTLMKKAHINIFVGKTSFLGNISDVLFIFCIASYYISLLVFLKEVFSGDIDLFEQQYVVPVLAIATQSVLKAAIIVLNNSEIRTVIIQLGSMWRMEGLTEQQIKKKNDELKDLNLRNSAFYWMYILGYWHYILGTFLTSVFRKLFLNNESELIFPFSCSFPFDATGSWFGYFIAYGFEVYGMLHLVYIYVGAESILIILCAHLNTQFSLVQEDLRYVEPISNGNRYDGVVNTNEIDNAVKHIVRRHQKLILLSNQLDAIFNKMIFANLLFASITICFFGFVTKTSREFSGFANSFIGICASILPIFNLCYYGELLTNASIGISDAAYESLWYQGDINYQKMLLFIIKRSQKPCCLTSWRYVQVSLKTFSTVLSTTWSYFSLINSVYDQ